MGFSTSKVGQLRRLNAQMSGQRFLLDSSRLRRRSYQTSRNAPTPVSVQQAIRASNVRSRQRAAMSPYQSCWGSCEKSWLQESLIQLTSYSIPLGIAVVLFLYLHRRHVKKLNKEDANDPHKSLDFGMDTGSVLKTTKKGKKGKKDGPEMAVTELVPERALRRPRGLSMDMDIGSPYVLPPGLHGSRESLHSISRTINNGDDPYRPVTNFMQNDTSSMQSRTSRRAADDSSSYAGSSSSGPRHEGMNQDLLRNAQRMSRSVPPTSRTPMEGSNVSQFKPPEPVAEIPRKGLPTKPLGAGLVPIAAAEPRDSDTSKDGVDLRRSNNYLGPFIHSREPSTDTHAQSSTQPKRPSPLQSQSGSLHSSPTSSQQFSDRKSPPPSTSTSVSFSRPPRSHSLKAASHSSQELNFFDDESDYGDGFKVTPPSPRNARSTQPSVTALPSDQTGLPPVAESAREGLDEPELGFDVRRLSMGFRPLPPDDPTDNPEQRANRIRSFYKEYFDESKAGPKAAAGQYYEDYDQVYLGDGTTVDPVSGQFATAPVPRTESYGRRAMTPPPRAPPRFQGSARHHATSLGGGSTPPGPRSFSSASARFGAPRGARRPPPLPKPLNVLPTPHLLKEDSFAMPIDFAPPSTYKDRVAGRPESPRGGSRAFSPLVPSHLPLASSFDDLSVMPSP